MTVCCVEKNKGKIKSPLQDGALLVNRIFSPKKQACRRCIGGTQGRGMQERIVPESALIAALRTRLLAVPAVAAVYLSAGKAADAGMVAYVVGGQRKALDAAIAGTGYPGPVALVRVHALPLRPDGSVDEGALTALPAWDEASMPLSAVYRPVAPLRPRIHLADILPDYPLLTFAAQEMPVARTLASGAAGKLAVSPLKPLSGQSKMPANLVAALERAAQCPELGIVHVAADMSEIRISYAELLDQARRLLGGLRSRGVRSGDVVLVDSGNSRSLLPLFWACLLGAIVPAPFKVGAAAVGEVPQASARLLGRAGTAADCCRSGDAVGAGAAGGRRAERDGVSGYLCAGQQ